MSATDDLRAAADDLYRALVSEHGHSESGGAPWPACLPVHIAMNRYREATIERCECGEIEPNRVHHESKYAAFHPFRAAAER